MKLRSPLHVRAALALPVMAVLGACSLFVDTGDLAGTADAGAPEAAVGSSDGSSPTGDAGSSEAAVVDPCANGPVLCETFDRSTSLPGYPQDTDPTSSIALDDAVSLSVPHSAKFVIEPGTDNGSPDATIQLETSVSLRDFIFEAAFHIERSEPDQAARLVLLGNNDETFHLDWPGKVIEGGAQIGDVGAIPTGRWVNLRVEARVSESRVTLTLDGVIKGSFALAATWQASPIFARLGISEANSPLERLDRALGQHRDPQALMSNDQ